MKKWAMRLVWALAWTSVLPVFLAVGVPIMWYYVVREWADYLQGVWRRIR